MPTFHRAQAGGRRRSGYCRDGRYTQAMSDLVQFSVHGPVQTLQIECAEWDLTGEDWQSPQTSNIYHFRRDGKISRSEHRNPNGSVSRSGYSYDEAGRMTETQFQVDDGPIHRKICHYDEFGRLIQTVSMNESGVQQISEIFSYDAAGRKTKVQVAPNDGEYHAFRLPGLKAQSCITARRVLRL